jgi:hypothetical protein
MSCTSTALTTDGLPYTGGIVFCSFVFDLWTDHQKFTEKKPEQLNDNDSFPYTTACESYITIKYNNNNNRFIITV